MKIDIFSRDANRPRHGCSAADAGDPFPALALARRLAPEQLSERVEQSGLAGKGGAGFPTHRKIELLRQQAAATKYLVVNGSEHEPGSLKDRFLLENHAVTVVEGALVLARAAGASEILITINEGGADAIAACRAAIALLAAGAGAGGMTLKLVPVPEAYIVGEESALLEVLEGRPPLPRKKPPFPIESGLYGRPTLIQNVETVAHLPYIVVHGPATYRALGVDGAGVTLCTFGPEFRHSGVQLIPLGTSVREVVYGYGGGLSSAAAIKAIQPGGPSTGFLRAAQFDIPFQDVALKLAGSALGCAAIRAFSDDDDMVAAVTEITGFFAGNSCGQCPQCRMQTGMLSNIMKQTLAGRGNPKLLKQIPVIINANVGKGICSLIRMPVAPVLSALKEFGTEFENCTTGSSLVGQSA